MCTIGFVGTLKRYDLVSEYILAWGNGGRNPDPPRIVVGDEIVGCPRAGRRRTIDKSSFGNLEELESRFLRLFTLTVTLCHVVVDRSMMRHSPLIPLQIDGGAGGDAGVNGTWRATLSTHNITITILGRRDESSVRGDVRPSNDFWRIVQLKRIGAGVESLVAIASVSCLGSKVCTWENRAPTVPLQ